MSTWLRGAAETALTIGSSRGKSNSSRGRQTYVSVLAALLIAVVAYPTSASSEESALLQAASPETSASWEAATEALAGLIKDKGALGNYIDDSGGFVVVVPSSGSSSFSLADAAALGVSVRIESQDLEPDEVRQIIDVAKERSWHPDAARYAMAITFDAKIGQVRIASNAPPDLFKGLQEQFPGLVHYDFRDITRSRHKDFEPHWGGAQMVRPGSPYSYDCTSGFSVWNTNLNPRMVTAAHCFTLNTTVNSPSGSTFGTVQKRQNYPTNDFELVGGGGVDHDPAIYVDGNAHNPSPYRWVQSAGNAGYNVEYCMSGATTYETCGWFMLDDDATFCDSDGCTLHVQEFLNQATVEAPCPGDSGAPVYRYVGTIYQSNVTIRGIVISGDCFEWLVMEKWPKIRDTYNVTIMTN